MTRMEILARLERTSPFNRLTRTECEIISAVMREVKFAPNSLVQPAGEPLSRLLLRLDGAWEVGGKPLPELIGVAALVEGRGWQDEIKAGPDGVSCLALGKGHFFTMTSECPAVVLALLSLADEAPEERTFQ